MAMLPTRYIHGVLMTPETPVLDRFMAAAAEADYHLNEALKSMKAAQAFLSSADVAQDHRERGVDREYVFRTLDGLLDIGRELKAGHGMLMFGDDSVAPSLQVQERFDGAPLPGAGGGATDRRAVRSGRPAPPPTNFDGAGEYEAPEVPGGPFSVFDR